MVRSRVAAAGMAAGPNRYTELLGRPSFRALWAAGGLTLAVIPVLLVILVWTATQAFPGLSPGARETDVALALSLLGLAATIPTLIAAFVSGTLADTFPRLRLMRVVNGVEVAGAFGMLLVLAIRPTPGIALPLSGIVFPEYLVLLFPLWALVSTAATLFRPALNASIPRVVDPSELGTANGALYAFGLTLSVAGTIAAPLLLSFWGIAAALAIPLGMLLVAQAFLGDVVSPLDARERGPRREFLHELTQGYRFLGQQRALLQLTVAALVINFLGAIAFIELGLYVTLTLGVADPVYLGALIAGASVGAAVGTLLMARLPFERRSGTYLAILAAIQGLLVIALGAIRWYPAALGDMFLYGLLPGMYTTVFFAVLQATVRNEMLGRVLSADEVGSYALVPVGQYVGGLLTLMVGVSSTFYLGGFGILATGLVMLALPDIRRLGFDPKVKREGPPPGALVESPARTPSTSMGSPSGE